MDSQLITMFLDMDVNRVERIHDFDVDDEKGPLVHTWIDIYFETSGEMQSLGCQVVCVTVTDEFYRKISRWMEKCEVRNIDNRTGNHFDPPYQIPMGTSGPLWLGDTKV